MNKKQRTWVIIVCAILAATMVIGPAAYYVTLLFA